MNYQAIKKSIFLSFLALCVGFFSGKAYLLHKKKRKLDAIIAIVNRPIKVFILSNDEKVVQSAMSQDYDNFQVLSLNNSNISLQPFDEAIRENKIITNALKKLDPNDIVVFIDNYRWFAHDHVLSRINQIYNGNDALALSCKELLYPNYVANDQSNKTTNVCCFVVKAFLMNKINLAQDDIAKVDDVLFLVAKKES